GAYPGIILAELGRGQRVDAAAQHGLGVIQRLMGLRAAFIALGGGVDLSLLSVSGMSREAAERFLEAGMATVHEAMRTQQPMPFNPADGSLAETGVTRKERLVFIPVVALREPIGILAAVGRKGSGDIKDRELLGVIGSALGLSLENLRQKEELRESETKFRTLTETVAAAAFIFQGTRIRYVNSAAEAITGYTRAELLTMNFWEVIHSDFREEARERGLARQRGEQVPPRYELKLLTKGGEERWVDFTAGAIEFEGKPAVLGTCFDIT
ncbi:unnamed protein product, partial [marine sediment metagenome]